MLMDWMYSWMYESILSGLVHRNIFSVWFNFSVSTHFAIIYDNHMNNTKKICQNNMIIIMDHLTLCSNNNNECWSSFCKKNSLLPSSIQRFFLFLDLYRNPELEKRRKDILQLRFSILDLVLRWIIEFYSMKSKLFI